MYKMRPLAFIIGIAVVTIVGCGKQAAESTKAKFKYPVLSPEILKAIPDAGLEEAIMDHIGFKIGGNYDDEYKIVTGLSKGFQMVYTTSEVEAEVDNGGFNQYFWNSSGQFQKEALEGYKLLGANEHADLMERAIQIYTREAGRLSKLKDKGTKEAFSESYKNNPLSQCDDEFYKLKVNLSARRIKYIREHPELFVGN